MQAVREMNPTQNPTAARAAALTMRGVVHAKYGTPDVLAVGEVARPVAGKDEVLVRVHAAGVSIGDHHVVTGKPYVMRVTPYGGVPHPKNLVPGTALSGRVEAVGANVTTFRPGDEVIGEALKGAFAEYAIVPANRLAPKPKNLSLENAAALPWAITALQGLRDSGGLQAGQKVLINGASGGVGGWAVQIAKALGAHVTAVCSTRNVERVRALGADEVIDYTKEDFAAGDARFDLVFDLVGKRSLPEFRRVLLPSGTYVSCGGEGGVWFGPMFYLARLFVTSWFTSQKLTGFFAMSNHDDLMTLKALVEEGKIRPEIERRYPIDKITEALSHVGEGHAQGQTILQISS